MDAVAVIRDERGVQICSEIEANRFSPPWFRQPSGELHRRRPHHPTAGSKTMAQCNSKVFFPDDPTQLPQFNECPRQSETTRRTVHSVMRLCSICARVWDEQDVQIVLQRSSDRAPYHRGAEEILATVLASGIPEADYASS